MSLESGELSLFSADEESASVRISRKPLLKPLLSSQRVKYGTPDDLREALQREFSFTLDPCPIDWHPATHADGLAMSWKGHRVYCNPPYGREIGRWLAKARSADLAVFLLPARTDTAWFHAYGLDCDEIRFLKSRLTFAGERDRAPFPSLLLIFRGPKL